VDQGLVDEIPGAYKDIDQVMDYQRDLGEIVAELKKSHVREVLVGDLMPESRKQAMRSVVVGADGARKHAVGRALYLAHALSVGRIVEEALNDTGELIGDEPYQEDICLAAAGHDLYADTSVTPEEIRQDFGTWVDILIEGMTNRPEDPNRPKYLARNGDAVEALRLIKLAALIDNITSCGHRIDELGSRWVRRTLMPFAGQAVLNTAVARYEDLPDTAALMMGWLRFAYKRMESNLDIFDELAPREPEKPARAAAKKAGAFDPEIGRVKLAQMKEREWREALLVRGAYLFPNW
jgi:hypothetical protein